MIYLFVKKGPYYSLGFKFVKPKQQQPDHGEEKIKNKKTPDLTDIIQNKDQIKYTRLLVRFKNYLAKQGKLRKAEKFLHRIIYLTKLKTKTNIILKILTNFRPIMRLKSLKRGRRTIFLPAGLSLQRSTAFAQRNIIAAMNKRSERFFINKAVAELIDIHLKKPTASELNLFALQKNIILANALL